MITINTTNFYKLQENMSETEFAKKLQISRTHLWRAKQGTPIGQEFIFKFKAAYPNKKFEDYFIIVNG